MTNDARSFSEDIYLTLLKTTTFIDRCDTYNNKNIYLAEKLPYWQTVQDRFHKIFDFVEIVFLLFIRSGSIFILPKQPDPDNACFKMQRRSSDFSINFFVSQHQRYETHIDPGPVAANAWNINHTCKFQIEQMGEINLFIFVQYIYQFQLNIYVHIRT